MMSSIHSGPDEPPSAPRAGADLRAARERLGWSLQDVAAGLRIRQPHLEALEAGRIDLLPGNAYAVGFLRTYASALGLDPDEISRRFKSEASEVTRKTELAFPAPVPERGVPAGAVVLLGVVLAVGAYAGWYRLSGEGRLPAETVAVPERLAPLAEQALPPVAPPREQVAAAEPAPKSTQAEPEPAPPTPSVSPSSAAAAQVIPPMQSPVSAAAAPAPVPPGAAASPPGNNPPQVVLRASADAWVQVRDKSSGQIYLNRILHAGETWPVPSRPNLTMTTGNAGGTELVVDGISTGVLGGSGVVRRDLPLDPDSIKEGRLTPSAANGIQPASVRTPPQ